MTGSDAPSTANVERTGPRMLLYVPPEISWPSITAPYHTPADTVEQVDFDRLSRVVDGLTHVTADLARASTPREG